MEAPPDPALATTSAPTWKRWVGAVLPSLGPPPFPGVGGTPAPPIVRRPGTVIIDARGFDRWGFADDFFAPTPPLRDFFADKDRRPPQILSQIAFDLSVRGPLAGGADFPPRACTFRGLGAIQGPASTNLMGLAGSLTAFSRHTASAAWSNRCSHQATRAC